MFLVIVQYGPTNLIDPAHPVELTPAEIKTRVWGSKVILLVEQSMDALQWGTKICLLLLYSRLTRNLVQNLVVKFAFAYVAVTFIVMEICYFAVWCRPFDNFWKTPTDDIECATATPHLKMNLAFNVSSDVLIMSIPLPLLLKTHLDLKAKIILACPFCMGLFTISCAIASKQLSFSKPYSPDWVYWYCREASTAIIVANMPYNWTLIRRMFHIKTVFGGYPSLDIQSGQMQHLDGVSLGRTQTGGSIIKRFSIGTSFWKSENQRVTPSRAENECRSDREGSDRAESLNIPAPMAMDSIEPITIPRKTLLRDTTLANGYHIELEKGRVGSR